MGKTKTFGGSQGPILFGLFLFLHPKNCKPFSTVEVRRMQSQDPLPGSVTKQLDLNGLRERIQSSNASSSEYSQIPFIVKSDYNPNGTRQLVADLNLSKTPDDDQVESFQLDFEKVETVDFLYWRANLSSEASAVSTTSNNSFLMTVKYLSAEGTWETAFADKDVTDRIFSEGKPYQGIFIGVLAKALSISVVVRKREYNHPTIKKKFTYASDFDKNGILYYLGTQGGFSDTWENPYKKGVVNISYTGEFGSPGIMKTENLITREVIDSTFFGGSKPQTLALDFGNNLISLDQYTIRHGYKYANSFIYKWIVSGSTDGINWVTLDSRTDSGFTKGYDTKTYDVANKPDTKFRFISITQSGDYYMPEGKEGAPFLCINGLEFYGTMTCLSSSSSLSSFTFSALTLNPSDAFKFKFVETFDTNGLIYWMGTKGLSDEFKIPSITGDVGLEFSHAEMFNPEMIPDNVLGRVGTSTFWGGSTPQWVIFDFGEGNAIRCSHYSIRHGYDGANSYLLDFTFEGSNDKTNWTLLHAERGPCFNRGYGEKSFEIKPTEQSFRYFRLLQKGNYYVLEGEDAPYLCLSGFEIYGDVSINPLNLTPLMRSLIENPLSAIASEKANLIEYSHTYDMDENGLLYAIGSEDRTKPYSAALVANTVQLTYSHPMYDGFMKPEMLLDRDNKVNFYWGGSTPVWVIIDVGEQNALSCSGYTLRHGFSSSNSFICNWTFEGSNDKEEWDVIHSGGSPPFDKGFDTRTWSFKRTRKFYRYFKLVQHGNYSIGTLSQEQGAPYLCIAALELYGSKKVAPLVHALANGEDREILRFSHISDFDTNGLLYYIGSQGKSTTYVNPHIPVSLKISSDQLYNPQEMHISNVISRDVVKATFWAGVNNLYFQIDLGVGSLFNAQAYTLRHGFSADNSYIYDWEFQGSNDSVTWETLHTGLETPFTKGFDVRTFYVKRKAGFFRYFRVLQKGNYSLGLGKEGGAPCLCINGFELYGEALVMKSRPSLLSNMHYGVSKNFNLEYEKDLDKNGILYFIGSGRGCKPFKNPIETGDVKVIPGDVNGLDSVIFDLQEYRIKPIKYTYTFLSNNKAFKMEPWELQASTDLASWETLHKGDTSKPQITFDIVGTQYYRYFRIVQVNCKSLLASSEGIPFLDFYGSGNVAVESQGQSSGPKGQSKVEEIRKSLGSIFFDTALHQELINVTQTEEPEYFNLRVEARALLNQIASSLAVVPENVSEALKSVNSKIETEEQLRSKQEECVIS